MLHTFTNSLFTYYSNALVFSIFFTLVQLLQIKIRLHWVRWAKNIYIFHTWQPFCVQQNGCHQNVQKVLETVDANKKIVLCIFASHNRLYLAVDSM